jgi:hypothetical protein
VLCGHRDGNIFYFYFEMIVSDFFFFTGVYADLEMANEDGKLKEFLIGCGSS